jgi:Tat protein translocase TatB subunit
MNIFSNIGITELLLILLLALLVVGPERLPELGRKLGSTLRDVRKAYDNLTRDLGPELASLQESTRELRESVESVRSIPSDMVQSMIDVPELQATVDELKEVADSVESVSGTLATTRKTIANPMGAAMNAAKSALDPKSAEGEKQAETTGSRDGKEVVAASGPGASNLLDQDETAIAPEALEHESDKGGSEPSGSETDNQGETVDVDTEASVAPATASVEESTDE